MVGIGKIENLKHFEKGHKMSVGHGRPKGKSLTKLLQEAIDSPITLKNKDGINETKTASEWIAIRAIRQAVQGDFKYFKEVKDTLDGMPLRKIENETKMDIDLSKLTNDQLKYVMDLYLGKTDE